MEPTGQLPNSIDSAKPQVDLELWIRFIEKVVEQTESGVLKWDLRYSGEYVRYAVCCIRNRTLWWHGRLIELVDANRIRWTINVPDSLRQKLIVAVGEQISPTVMASTEQFAREFLGEGKDDSK